MQKTNNRIAFIQSFIAHYREDFFLQLSQEIDINLFCFRKPPDSKGFNESIHLKVTWLKSMFIGSFTLFNPFNKNILQNRLIVIVWNPRYPSLFILLLFNRLLNNKIIIWTHGISVKNGFHPKSLRDKIKLLFFNLADGICFYTVNELNLLSPYLTRTKTFYLNNTLNVEKIISRISSLDTSREKLKNKYGIQESKVVIYCARFIKERRSDLLIELIKMAKNDNLRFIIIGGGPNKPDFSIFENVNDFGSVYNPQIKAELFLIADFSFQPAWTGLSVVESFAHGVPYITLVESDEIFQCVEYGYIVNNKNGFILNDLISVREILNIKNYYFARLPNQMENENYQIHHPRYIKLPGEWFQRFEWYFYYHCVKKFLKEKQIDFDIIHSHGLYPCGFVSAKIAQYYNKPFIQHLHDSGIKNANNSQNNFYKYVFETAISLIAVSKKQKINILKAFGNKYSEKTQVIHNGVDFPLFNHNKKTNFSRKYDKVKIVSVGNLIDVKGFNLLIRTISKLNSQNSKYYLTIIGDGPERQSLEKLTKSLNAEAYIRFIGSVINERLNKEFFLINIPMSLFQERFSWQKKEAGILID